MIHQFEKFKLPTLFGLGIILAGIIAGIVLIKSENIFLSEASLNLAPKNITISNIEATSITISWQTIQPAYSIVSYNLPFSKQYTEVDERDKNTASLYTTHFVKLKNLQPKTTYNFKIISEKIKSDNLTFQTAGPTQTQVNFGPVIGSVVDGENLLTEGLIYMSIPGSITQSAIINNQGNFVIPINSIYTADLSELYPLSSETIAKLSVVSKEKMSQVIFKLTPDGTNLPPIILGHNLDLTAPPLEETTTSAEASPSATLSPNDIDLEVFDLNGDTSINATDNAIVLKNFGKSPQNKKADLNSDGVVDQKDLNLMSEKINQFIER